MAKEIRDASGNVVARCKCLQPCDCDGPRAPRVLLAMILKNEGSSKPEPPRLRDTLESLRAALGEYYAGAVIDDTGSTDDTCAIVWDVLGVHSTRRPFGDFSNARNACLDRAEQVATQVGATHVLMASAGCIAIGALDVEALRSAPAAPVFQVQYHMGDTRYAKPMLFCVGSGWRFQGVTHEAAVGSGKSGPLCGIELVYPGRADAARRERWQRDLALLSARAPRTPREQFYYAQTLDCLGMTEAAYHAYSWRVYGGKNWDATRGYAQERAVSLIRMVRLAPSLLEAARVAQVCERLDPSRGEAMLELAARAYNEAETPEQWSAVEGCAVKALGMVPTPDALFVDASREWRCYNMIGLARYWRKQWGAAVDAFEAALACEVGPRGDAEEQINARIAKCVALATEECEDSEAGDEAREGSEGQ